jgi:hypothetical protein
VHYILSRGTVLASLFDVWGAPKDQQLAGRLASVFQGLAICHECKTVGYVKVRHRFRRYSSDETCLA